MVFLLEDDGSDGCDDIGGAVLFGYGLHGLSLSLMRLNG
jgi:hypothetical protein